MTVHEYTALFPFGGIGGGALGFQAAEARLFDRTARFRVLGGIDFDAGACADFEALVGAPSPCRDVADMTPDELRERFGFDAPDVVFLSPPCKGASGLLSKAASQTEKYQQMNELALVWIRLMLDAWPVPPRLVLLENVPRLATRAPKMLAECKRLLRAAGYVLHQGFHECGELGGLAQVRRRFLLVARHAGRVAPLLYQPPRKRVRGVGEVLGQLPIPLPGSTDGGAMHRLPRLSWRNWVRLALIPAGGDWRDLEGVLRDGQPRREVFRRHFVQRWQDSAATVAGSGSNGVNNVADPRVLEHLRVPRAYDHGYGVLRWDEPSSTVAGGSHPGQGAYSVADVRVGRELATVDWAEAACSSGSEESPVILAHDGSWHRPLTTLELAALQGFPAHVGGRWLQLSGTSQSAWRERIGNAVPPPTAQAVATRMLTTLLQSEVGAWSLSGDGAVWVRDDSTGDAA